jgi:hypothetical protein
MSDELEEIENVVEKPVAFELTPEHEAKILHAWNVLKMEDLKPIIEYTVGAGYDGRSKQGMAVKKFLASRNLKAVPAQDKPTHVLRNFELTTAHKEFIVNNADSYENWLDLAKELFADTKLTPLHAEARAVKQLFESLKPESKDKDDLETEEYNPPRTDKEAIARINRNVLDGINPDEITPKQKDYVGKLLKFMRTFRFIHEMNLLTSKKERRLFEGSFIRYIWDKPDLTEEEIELYLNHCSDLLSYHRMKKEEEDLIAQINIDRANNQGRIGMPLIEYHKSLRDSMGKCLDRQKRTLQDLNGKRSELLKNIKGGEKNILRLVEAWREKTKRDQIAKIAELRSKKVKDEFKRLETMDDLSVEIFGLDINEIFL